MTNKEAIMWLRQIDDKYIHGGDEEFDRKRKEAIAYAIAVLENSASLVEDFEKLFHIMKGE